MKSKTIAKICFLVSLLPIYLFIKDDSQSPWMMVIFFACLAFGGLFNLLGEQDEEIAVLRSSKESQQEEKDWKAHWNTLTEAGSRSHDPFYIPDSKKKQKLLEEIVGKKGEQERDMNIK